MGHHVVCQSMSRDVSPLTSELLTLKKKRSSKGYVSLCTHFYDCIAKGSQDIDHETPSDQRS